MKSQILPTTESQVRPLKSLEPKEQQEAWQTAVARAKGVPSAKIVREVVNQIKGHKGCGQKSLVIANSDR